MYIKRKGREKRERRDMKKECAAMSVTENCSDRIETRSHPVHFENNLLQCAWKEEFPLNEI